MSQAHEETISCDEQSDVAAAEPVGKPKRVLYRCTSGCNRAYITPKNFRKHMLESHDIETDGELPESEPIGGTSKRHAGAKRGPYLQLDKSALKAAKDRFRIANDALRAKKVREAIQKVQELYERDGVWAVRLSFDFMTQAEKNFFVQRLRLVGITIRMPVAAPYITVDEVRNARDKYKNTSDDEGAAYFLAKTQADLVV